MESLQTNNNSERRLHDRININVIVHFNVHGNQKVFESITENISLSGFFISASRDVTELLDVGASLQVMVEYKKNLLVKITSYVVRIDNSADICGFAIKFLDLDSNQKDVLSTLLI